MIGLMREAGIRKLLDKIVYVCLDAQAATHDTVMFCVELHRTVDARLWRIWTQAAAALRQKLDNI
jgi:hypothetical protein